MLTRARSTARQASVSLRSTLTTEIVRPLLEPILHPSRWRIRALGLSTAMVMIGLRLSGQRFADVMRRT